MSKKNNFELDQLMVKDLQSYSSSENDKNKIIKENSLLKIERNIIRVTIDENLYKRLRILQVDHKFKISTIVRVALEEFIKQEKFVETLKIRGL